MATLPPLNTPFLDKLKFALPLCAFGERQIDYVTQALTEHGSGYAISTNGKGYRHRVRFNVTPEDDPLIVECGPNRPDRAHWLMTFEYNPSRLDEEQRKALLRLVKELLGPDARALLAQACLLEPHLAFDVPHPLDAILFESRTKTTSATWGKNFGTGGVQQTQYLGSLGSDNQQCIYDKCAHLWETKLQRIDGPRTRFEDRISLARVGVPLHQLQDVRDPFGGLHVYALKNVDKLMTSLEGRLFLRVAQLDGLQAALGMLSSKSKRDTMRRRFSKAQVNWWKPAVFVGALTAALKATGLFPPEAFKAALHAGTEGDRQYRLRKHRAAARNKPRVEDPHFMGLDDEDEEDVE
jgi:hypothetical protein